MKSKAQEFRPLVFIGTTTEALDEGRALELNLVQDHNFEVKLWKHDVFRPSENMLDDLVRAAEEVDYAVFILTPDDRRQSRGKQAPVPRDNLIFEFGLFTALKGRGRVFAIVPRDKGLVLPTDLLGITTINYLDRDRAGWESAMSSVATKLADIVRADTSSNELKTRSNIEDDGEGERSKRASFPRQVAACSIETTFKGHVPLREVDCVASCFEDAVEASLVSVKQSAASQAEAVDDPDSRLFRQELHNLLEQTHVRLQGTTAAVVWELPQGIAGKKLETALAIVILDFISLLQGSFRKGLFDLGLAFREHLPKVILRVALSTGKALLRTSKFGDDAHYMGPCVDEVTALRGAIETGGVIANLRVAPYLFMERLCAKEGRPDCKRVGVNGETCPVWITEKPLLWRRPKEKPLQSLRAVLDWAGRPYVDPGLSGATMPPLTEDDLVSVFRMREIWESRFAKDLSTRMIREKDGETLLQCLEDTIKAMQALSEGNSNAMEHPDWRNHGARFHSQIAELSDPKERDHRRRFAEWIYEFTKFVYWSGMVDPKNHNKPEESVVIDEHRHMLDLIRRGQADDAEAVTLEHLVQHYGRASDALLRCLKA